MEDFYCSEIISGKTEVEIIFETELVMAFHHTDPYFEQHVVIIPKAHITSLAQYPNTPELNQDIFKAITLVSKQLEEDYGGCRVSSNVGDYQSTKHLHWYVHHGKRLRTENGERIENPYSSH